MPDTHIKKASEYKVGDPVTYVPHHANGDASHPDCESGIVSTIREGVEDRLWVKFKSSVSQCCYIETLR
jgi:hypothetical protein